MDSTGATLGAMLLFIVAGLFSGFVFSIFSLVKKAVKNNFIVVFVADVTASLVAGLVFILCVFQLEYGEFALFEVVSFMVGITFEKIFVQNIIAKPIIAVYNKLKVRRQIKKEKAKG